MFLRKPSIIPIPIFFIIPKSSDLEIRITNLPGSGSGQFFISLGLGEFSMWQKLLNCDFVIEFYLDFQFGKSERKFKIELSNSSNNLSAVWFFPGSSEPVTFGASSKVEVARGRPKSETGQTFISTLDFVIDFPQNKYK